jgi:hypothetical protein
MSENDNSRPTDATVRLRRPGASARPYKAAVLYAQDAPYGGPSHTPDAPYGSPLPAAGPVRPRLLWIFLAWVLFAVMLVAGVGGFAGGLFSTINDTAPATTFSSGQTVNVALDPKDKPAIYASADQPTDVRCQVGDGQDPNVTLTHPSTSQTVSAGDVRWELLFTVGVPKAATYPVGCEGDGVTFGVGKELTAGAATLAGGVLALLTLPAIGFLSAVTVTIVVLVWRSGDRRRMAA